ncbi:unnamed protein product [Darwinula stevensoni]|uniref:Large ribosomal subunit protein mL53 n=1 Tax=Darwinula stevensoni TaxID=69355 RepID=A0A7R8XCB7_9CRUS|nr:unnamed protein product [Darwinula stevensoni]CAG0893619.1 unnamed protein product [Darwinula stevensoni]
MARKLTINKFGKVINPIRHAIAFEGRWGRPPTTKTFIAEQIRKVDLRPVKAVNVRFDPFHPNAQAVREFMFITSFPKIRKTNLKCTFKCDVVNDRSEPSIFIDFENKQKCIFKAGSLNILDILQNYNKVVEPILQKYQEDQPKPFEVKVERKRRR